MIELAVESANWNGPTETDEDEWRPPSAPELLTTECPAAAHCRARREDGTRRLFHRVRGRLDHPDAGTPDRALVACDRRPRARLIRKWLVKNKQCYAAHPDRARLSAVEVRSCAVKSRSLWRQPNTAALWRDEH